MKRDEEISRLIKYAQGMGVTVRFKPYVKGSKDEADWALDGSEITIYTTSRTSKIQKILSLIHELSHQKAFIDAGRVFDSKIEEALDSDAKRHRKRVYDMEVADSVYWEDIYKDTNCQFDIKKLYQQRELDIWMYEVYYKTAKFPTVEEKKRKMKSIKRIKK
jgi:hypothetical protein